MNREGKPAIKDFLKNISLLRQQAYIDGSWVHALSKKTLVVQNPADSQDIGTVPSMDEQDCELALAAASKAFKTWRSQTAKQRQSLLNKWYQLVIENTDDLAKIMVLEQGKPLAEARGEVAYAASFIQWFSEQGKRVNGILIPAHQPNKKIEVNREPVGVVGIITPWNFPLAMITRKAAPALAAGCTVVIKPARLTPYSAYALAVLAEQAGIPAGVFNVITGDSKAIGSYMAESMGFAKISFTGSTPIGRILMAQSAKTIKRLSLELGGNAPFIVFADVDIDKIIEEVIKSKFRNSGQTCVCANRIFVDDKIYDVFAEKLSRKVSLMKVGNGFEEGVVQGPLINQAAVEKVESHIADAKKKGARVLCGGKRHRLGGGFFEPTVLADVSADTLFFSEETFGPVAPLIRFKSEEEAVDMANNTEFGLAAYFATRDFKRIERVKNALQSGIIGINEGIISTEIAPFGGVKQSGLGREGSELGIDEYLEYKYSLLSYI